MWIKFNEIHFHLVTARKTKKGVVAGVHVGQEVMLIGNVKDQDFLMDWSVTSVGTHFDEGQNIQCIVNSSCLEFVFG